MDYKSKYLKYQIKYQNLLKLVGGADPYLEIGIQESILEETSRLSRINTEFERRLSSARILVIGAGFDQPDDFQRWGQIDPNFLGVSRNSNDPIGQLGDWSNEPETYWRIVFEIILKNRKFDAIYIDQGTIQHMIKVSYKESFKYDVFKYLIEYIAEKEITDKLFVEFDAFNLDKRINEKEGILNEIGLRYMVHIENEWRKVLSEFRKYFKCCGEVQKLLSNLIVLEDTRKKFSKWIAYLRR
jgi:hypothetical protein